MLQEKLILWEAEGEGSGKSAGTTILRYLSKQGHCHNSFTACMMLFSHVVNPLHTQLLSISNLSMWRGKKASIQVIKSTFYWEMYFKTSRGGEKIAKDIKDHF